MTTSSCNVIPPTGPSAPAVTLHPHTVPSTRGMRVVYHPLQRGPCGSGGRTRDWTPQPGWSASTPRGFPRRHRADATVTGRTPRAGGTALLRQGTRRPGWGSLAQCRGLDSVCTVGQELFPHAGHFLGCTRTGSRGARGLMDEHGPPLRRARLPPGAQGGAAFVPRPSAEASLAPGQGQAVSSMAAPRPPHAGQPDPQHYVCHRTETERM